MIVVIGATGFVGSHLLCQLVQTNDKVRALYRNEESIKTTEHFLHYYNLSPTLFKERVEWIKADVLDIESLLLALSGARYVYNCSGYVSFDKRDKSQMIAVNVNGTSNIVNACLLCKCTKLVHLSSIAAIGDTNSTEPITEENQWVRTSTESWYSITKFNAETEAWRGIAEGLPTLIFNPSIILGPGNWSSGSPKFFSTINKGLKYYTKGTVGYVDVRDVCRVMIIGMNSIISGEKYIISGSNQTYQTLFSTIAKAINKLSPQINATALMLAFAWRIEKIRSIFFGKAPLITKNSARTALKQSFYSSQKCIDTFGIEFKSFDETIEFTGKCFLKDTSAM